MPRTARIVLPGYLHHVTQRGNYKQFVFEEDTDRVNYLHLMQKYSVKHQLDIFAYCLMPNHVHFIVRPQQKSSMAETFCRVHQIYSSYFHGKKGIKGHLWQERFYSCVLHEDHIRNAVRYVERNPVRARMVYRPWEYTWSTARAHLGKEYKLIQLADIKEYIDVSSWEGYLAGEERDDDLKLIRQATFKGNVLGPEEFLKSLEDKLKRKIIPRPNGRPKTSDRHNYLPPTS